MKKFHMIPNEDYLLENLEEIYDYAIEHPDEYLEFIFRLGGYFKLRIDLIGVYNPNETVGDEIELITVQPNGLYLLIQKFLERHPNWKELFYYECDDFDDDLDSQYYNPYYDPIAEKETDEGLLTIHMIPDDVYLYLHENEIYNYALKNPREDLGIVLENYGSTDFKKKMRKLYSSSIYKESRKREKNLIKDSNFGLYLHIRRLVEKHLDWQDLFYYISEKIHIIPSKKYLAQLEDELYDYATKNMDEDIGILLENYGTKKFRTKIKKLYTQGEYKESHINKQKNIKENPEKLVAYVEEFIEKHPNWRKLFYYDWCDYYDDNKNHDDPEYNPYN